MIKIKIQDLVDFIFAQPDDRRVDMMKNYSDEACGCIMVHFGKEKLGLIDFSCGVRSWQSKYGIGATPPFAGIEDVGFHIIYYFGIPDYEEYSYGEIKGFLAKKGFAPTISVDNSFK